MCLLRWGGASVAGKVICGSSPFGADKTHDPFICLLDAQTQDRPADHELLDLLGAFEDVVDLSWTYPLVAIGAFLLWALGKRRPALSVADRWPSLLRSKSRDESRDAEAE